MQQLVSLEKGQRVDLTKAHPGLILACIGLGWDVRHGAGDDFDLDAFAMVLSGGKLLDNQSIIYFGHLKGHGIEHTGDNLTGAGDGDDETINVHLEQLPPACDEVVLAVNIYRATERHEKFGQVENAFIRVYNGATKEEILRYDLTEDYSTNTGVVMGKLYKKDNEWKFQALGQGVNGTINDIAAPYAR